MVLYSSPELSEDWFFKKMSDPSAEDIQSIVGFEFPGGNYLIEHWENFLLTECTGGELLPDGIVHPVALFHVPITGSGTSLKEMFALGKAASDFSINIESYDWEIFSPMYEDELYDVSGKVLSASRIQDSHGRNHDRIQFQFEIRDDDELISRTTITWLYARNARSTP
jgi:hypothetical protein